MTNRPIEDAVADVLRQRKIPAHSRTAWGATAENIRMVWISDAEDFLRILSDCGAQVTWKDDGK